MTITSQQLRELAGKATQGAVRFDHDWARRPTILDRDGREIAEMAKSGFPERNSRTPEQEANAKLIAALWNNREALLTALELQERLDKPETVEVVARAIFAQRHPASNPDALLSGNVPSWRIRYLEAQAAINALRATEASHDA